MVKQEMMLAVAATKHLEDKAKGSFIIENIFGKLIKTRNFRPFPLFLTPWKISMADMEFCAAQA